MKNILSVIFENEAEAYQALSEFKRDPANGDYVISNAAVVKRNGEALSVLDGFTIPSPLSNSTKGWIIGMITGVFFGFYAMIMGACIGSLTGMYFDSRQLKNNSALMQENAQQLEEGRTALIMLCEEKTAGVIDGRLSKYDISLLRTNVSDRKEELPADSGQLHSSC